MLRNFGILIKNVRNSQRSFSQTASYFAKKEPVPEVTVEKIEDPKEEKVEKAKVSKKEPVKDKIPNLVCTDKDGPVYLIGINRPEVRNAINNVTALQICEAFMKFEEDPESKVAVLYGIGGSFCSGYDLKELASEDGNISTDLLMSTEGSVGPTRRHVKKPVVCSIDGYCVANGLELALMCDLRVMEENATLGFFNRKFGVPIIDGGSARLSAMIGFSRALDLILTGRSVDANEALQIGLINRVVATGTSLGQAVKLACTLAKFPQAALNHDRNSLYASTYDSPSFNQSVQNEVMYTSKEVIDEMTEGVRLYIEAAKTKSGAKKSNVLTKEKSMADWEKEEICKEKPRELKKIQVEQTSQVEKEEVPQKTKGEGPPCPQCGAPLNFEIPRVPYICYQEKQVIESEQIQEIESEQIQEIEREQVQEKNVNKNKSLQKNPKYKICPPSKNRTCPDLPKTKKSEDKNSKNELKKIKIDEKPKDDKSTPET